jgi:hypothetical protein
MLMIDTLSNSLISLHAGFFCRLEQNACFSCKQLKYSNEHPRPDTKFRFTYYRSTSTSSPVQHLCLVLYCTRYQYCTRFCAALQCTVQGTVRPLLQHKHPHYCVLCIIDCTSTALFRCVEPFFISC